MALGSRSKTRGRGRSRKRDASDMPDVYQEMLADAGSSPTRVSEEGQTLKRRRVGGRLIVSGETKSSEEKTTSAASVEDDQDVEEGKSSVSIVPSTKQTIYNDSDDSEDSDMDWEDVNFPTGTKETESVDKPGDLSLVIGDDKDEGKKAASSNRKPITAAERKARLEIHKMHLLSLLSHVHLRNHWCNGAQVQNNLLELLSDRTRSYLDDDESQSQFQRSRSLVDGLEQASEAFRTNFKIKARGMSKCYWAEDPEQLAKFELPDDIELPMQKLDFREAASKLEGSRDVGAQLFCAMLRAAGIEARLVCSLQLLPFTAAAKGYAPINPGPSFTVTGPETRIGISEEDSGQEGTSDTSTDRSFKPSSIRARITGRYGRSAVKTVSPVPVTTPKLAKHKKQVRESPYPVFWIEAFSAAIQKWLSVDPLVTKKIAKPSKFEPPASDPSNSLSYVIAFEEDGSARDVTRRYARAYNAKTRRQRVESTKEGDKWWKRVMRIYKRPFALDRDQVEDAELNAKEATEGMPRNIVEFRNHPHYVLERHLRRNEFIHPRREVGKVSATKLADGDRAVEPVFRRGDVHVVKSEDNWYRLGRDVKDGEEPLKVVTPRRKKDPLFDEDASEGDEDVAGVAMYAAFQTSTYKAPPVVNGRIPRNVYGNLDVYVASMVPAGGVHISHPDTARAARVLGIDYVDAVTGFEFRGRTGTAVVKGAVVAGEYHDAVVETIHGFEYAREEEEMSKRSQETLRLWRRFLIGLRIKERIEGYTIEGERSASAEEDTDDEYQDGDEEEEDEEEGEGGFLPDRLPDKLPEKEHYETIESAVPRISHRPIISTWGAPYKGTAPRALATTENDSNKYDQAGGSAVDDDGEGQGGGFFNEDETVPSKGHLSATPPSGPPFNSTNEGYAGGFVHQDMADEDDPASHSNNDTLAPSQEYIGVRPTQLGVQSPASIPSISPDELEEARLLQQLHEAERCQALSKEDSTKSTNLPDSGRRLEEGSNSNAPDATPLQRKESSSPSSASDKGSLLSQDPDDEDADPEWLA